MRSSATGISSCIGCGGEIRPEDRFCGSCGTSLIADDAQPSRDAFTVLTPSLVYYFLTLTLLAAYKLTDIFDAGFESFLGVTIADTLIIIIFWIIARKDLAPLFAFKGIRISVVLLTIAGAILGCLVVSITADFINVSLFESTFSDAWLFEETSAPLLYAVIFTCVQPAIFEEVAFRGFLFNNIQQVTTPSGAVYITAFIFGIIHLAVISMLWLVPLGLIFGILRAKYNTLWYGVIGHFTYNLGFVLLEHGQTLG
jgi:membrane protease YdiL (CAAX protease family)